MITLLPVRGLPEVMPGDDLARLVAGAAALQDGDVLVLSQKIVSKAEGALVSPMLGEDPAAARARLARSQSRRVVADSDRALIVETSHGFVCANAGIDTSNVGGGALTLLPADADASARGLRADLEALTGLRLAVVVADTFGRPWRVGQTDVAIGVAGLPPVRDERGGLDHHGQVLAVTEVAVADEVAGAADLVRRKADRVPAVVVRGLAWSPDDDAAATALVRTGPTDLFPRGRGMIADHLAGRQRAADLPGDIPDDAWDRAAAAAGHTGGLGMTARRGPDGLVLTGEPLAVGAGAGAAVAALVDLGHDTRWARMADGSVVVRPAQSGPPSRGTAGS